MAPLNPSKSLKLQDLKDGFSGKVAHHHFGDIDELATFLPGDIRLNQLNCQPFRCSSVALAFAPLRFEFNHVNCKLHAVGDKYAGFLTFTCLLQGQEQPIIAKRFSLGKDYLWGFDPHREADLVFPGHSTHCAIHIRQDLFAECVQVLDRLDLDAQFLGTNWVYSPDALPPLRAYLNQLYTLLRQRSPLLHQQAFQQLILQDFLPLLVTALPLQPRRKVITKGLRRSHLVQQANDYLQSHLDHPLTLTDLCQALGTSSRALCYGFQEIFGMSPMAYLKILRLQGVFRALKAAEPGTTTVTAMAAQFGFCHLGYFARDYQKVFGELPSETLKRVR